MTIDDPRVLGASCYVSRAQAGGISGAVGLAEDPSRMSIACRGTGPITLKTPLEKMPDREDVFDARASALFKSLTVTRFVDRKRQTLVYLIWSSKLINGSPFNSVTAIPLRPGT